MKYIDDMKSMLTKKWCTKEPSADDICEILNAMKEFLIAGLADEKNAMERSKKAVERMIDILLKNGCKSDSTTVFLVLNDIYTMAYDEMKAETLEFSREVVRKKHGLLDKKKIASEGLAHRNRRN